MMVMGWWAAEGFSVMATFLPLDAMAAQIVCRNITFFFFSLPIGMQVAATVTVGNFIGAGNLKAA